MLSPDHCPAAPEETAEAYLLGNLSPDEARAFDGHCITCSRCAAILAYVVAMKQAEQRLRGSEK
jgi:anti-sigma factor RsiW